jgi:methyl-accepting chemotaxis protein
MKEIARGEGDLTREVTISSADEIGQAETEINHLITALREMIAKLYIQAEHIAVSVSRVSQGTTGTVSASVGQKEQALSVAVATEEMVATLNDVAGNTQRAAILSSQVDSAASEGSAMVEETCKCINLINENLAATLRTVERLETSSNEIGEIISLIEDIADQTNLLALNASIEAARAGEHGRGFAVVAHEIKKLSAKTAVSTKQIAAIIRNVQNESREAAISINGEKERVEESVEKSLAAKKCLERILMSASESADLINQIASATEQQSCTTNEISSNIHRVSDTATTVHAQMENNGKAFLELSETAEQIFQTDGKFSVGNHHDTMKSYLIELHDCVVSALEKAVAEKRITPAELFDRTYQPLPNTTPQKFTTTFDKFFDRYISPFQEEILEKDGNIFFAICVDDNGYVPCHNQRYSRPLTGDMEIDSANNRTKRKFDDRTGIWAAQNREKFLLQTYARDTGEIMNDISTPIFIQERHWGAIRIGYRAS